MAVLLFGHGVEMVLAESFRQWTGIRALSELTPWVRPLSFLVKRLLLFSGNHPIEIFGGFLSFGGVEMLSWFWFEKTLVVSSLSTVTSDASAAFSKCFLNINLIVHCWRVIGRGSFPS